MTSDYQKKVENDLVKEFLTSFHEKIGYYPVVIMNEKSNINHSKTISLEELEKYFEPYLPTIYGKKQNLASRNRHRPLTELRFIFSQLARSLRYSLKEIAIHLGKRDHSTIVHALSAFKNFYETDEIFKKRYHQIVNDIKKNYEPSTLEYIDQTQDQSQSNLFFGLL
jgi:hypothetical protein